MTMCNVKGVAHSEEPTERCQLCKSLQLYGTFRVFQPIVLVLWPTTLLFWFTFTALIDSFQTADRPS